MKLLGIETTGDVADLAVLDGEEVEAKLAFYEEPLRFTGDTAPYHGKLAARFGEPSVTGPGRARPRAESVARLARTRLLAGEADDRMTLAPHYVRPSAAEARWRET